MTPQELEDWEYVKSKMENEGFHYCFIYYSRFEEIKDDKFHELRKTYIESAKLLEQYINDKINSQIE